MVKIDSTALNVSKRRDPNGFYVALIGKEPAAIIMDAVSELGIDVAREGDMIILRGKSWAKFAALINKARERGIKVLYE